MVINEMDGDDKRTTEGSIEHDDVYRAKSSPQKVMESILVEAKLSANSRPIEVSTR